MEMVTLFFISDRYRKNELLGANQESEEIIFRQVVITNIVQ